MYEEVKIDFGNLLLSLSDAMDLASPDIASHGIRTAFVAWEVGRETGLDARRLGKLVAAALLHDVGALSVEEKVKLMSNEEMDTNPHCIRGAVLLERAGILRDLAPVVRSHHRTWREWGPGGHGEECLLSQILLLADKMERSVVRGTYVLHQNQKLREVARSLANTMIDPDLVESFLAASERDDFWLDLVSPRLYSQLLHRGPFCGNMVGLDDLLEVSMVFRDIIDFRSRFTATHSSGVGRSAVLLAEIFGMSEPEQRLMQVAGDVHDLGKLAVPNAILDKPEGLTAPEFQVMKKHTYFTYTILNSVGGLRQVPEWAAFHHERLDGKGYPFRVGRDRLDSGARIMAVADIFTALAEDRPYRAGLETAKIDRILNGMADDHKLDRQMTQLLVQNLDHIRPIVQETQEAMREFYETQFVPAGA
jgi:HD-GYP domain-containing protein (c-di-GMP phosphodiesterase class II)